MATSLTVKCSPNREAIVRLESVLTPARASEGELSARAGALRATLPNAKLRAKDTDGYKRERRQ